MAEWSTTTSVATPQMPMTFRPVVWMADRVAWSANALAVERRNCGASGHSSCSSVMTGDRRPWLSREGTREKITGRSRVFVSWAMVFAARRSVCG